MVIDKGNINEILIKHDPKGLIGFGAPLDEYMIEAEYLSNNIKEGISEKAIYNLAKENFKERFGGLTLYEHLKLRRVAKDIGSQFSHQALN